VRLRVLEAADADQVAAWWSDPEIRHLALTGHERMDRGAVLDAIQHALHERYVLLGVEVDGALVGQAGLRDIEEVSGTAEVGIVLESKGRGRGVGRETVTQLLALAFDEMKLHHVIARTFAYNDRAIRLFRGLGFREEGRLREHRRLDDGTRADEIVFGITAPEWRREAARAREASVPLPFDEPGNACFACSPRATRGLGLRPRREGDAVVADVAFAPDHVGPPGIVHGGLVATALDDVGVWALWAATGETGLLADLRVTYRAPARPGRALVARAGVERTEGRDAWVRATLSDGDTLLAEAALRFRIVLGGRLEP